MSLNVIEHSGVHSEYNASTGNSELETEVLESQNVDEEENMEKEEVSYETCNGRNSYAHNVISCQPTLNTEAPVCNAGILERFYADEEVSSSKKSTERRKTQHVTCNVMNSIEYIAVCSTINSDTLELDTEILDSPYVDEEAFPARYAFALLGFLGIFNVYAMRVNLSVAMVAMVRTPPTTDESSVACMELLPHIYSNNTANASKRGEFDWDSSTQALILGAFFYGYVATQIPGGIFAEKYGAKWLFGLGVLITAIFTLLTPVAARLGVGFLLAVRFIEGLGEGVTFPAMTALIGRWVPKLERSRISTIIHSGSALGTVVSLSISGMLSDTDFLGGWPSVFYVFGTLGCLWFVLWIAFIHEGPHLHPRITKSELAYIRAGQDHVLNSKAPIPWRSILTSTPVWALVVTHFGYNWGFYTLLTELPTYLSNILHFKLKKNGMLSALPYLLQAMFAFMASLLADKMRATGKFRITTIRKAMNSVAFYVPGLIVLLVAFVGCDPAVIVVLLTVSVGLNGFMHSGFNITHVDMSPEFAGTLMGITNCVANMAGFLAPAYVGWVIKDGQTLQNWGIVFITTSAVYYLTGSIYNIFGSAELQPWGLTERSNALQEDLDNKRTSLTDTDRRNSDL